MYRTYFEQQFGSAYCYALRAEQYGSHGREPCALLVEQAARLLLSMLDMLRASSTDAPHTITVLGWLK